MTDFKYKPHPAQEEFFKRTEDHLFFGGGQPSKSQFVRDLLKAALKHKFEVDEKRWEEEFNGHRKTQSNNQTSK